MSSINDSADAGSERPQRHWIDTRRGVHEAAIDVITRAHRTIRCVDATLERFALGSRAASEALSSFLTADRRARVLLLIESTRWWESSGARLGILHRRFTHALEIRVASADDPVGDDSYLLADDKHALSAVPTARGIAELWITNLTRVAPLIAAFDRRWNTAAHGLPVVPLGL